MRRIVLGLLPVVLTEKMWKSLVVPRNLAVVSGGCASSLYNSPLCRPPFSTAPHHFHHSFLVFRCNFTTSCSPCSWQSKYMTFHSDFFHPHLARKYFMKEVKGPENATHDLPADLMLLFVWTLTPWIVSGGCASSLLVILHLQPSLHGLFPPPLSPLSLCLFFATWLFFFRYNSPLFTIKKIIAIALHGYFFIPLSLWKTQEEIWFSKFDHIPLCDVVTSSFFASTSTLIPLRTLIPDITHLSLHLYLHPLASSLSTLKPAGIWDAITSA